MGLPVRTGSSFTDEKGKNNISTFYMHNSSPGQLLKRQASSTKKLPVPIW